MILFQMTRLHACALLRTLFFCTLLLSTTVADAEDKSSTHLVRELSLVAKPLPKQIDAVRLLPTYTECRDGNAAVILLRMIWEQQAYMRDGASETERLFEEYKKAPEAAAELDWELFRGNFESFVAKLSHAAHLRNADWNYPLDSPAPGSILLPDLQGGRQFVFRGLSLWIVDRILRNDIDGAVESISTGIACSRHYAQSPFVVAQLVAGATADEMLKKVELLAGHPASPNLYYALTLLPEEIGNVRRSLQWESNTLRQTMPTLQNGWPDAGSKQEKALEIEFEYALLEMMPRGWQDEELSGLKQRLAKYAESYLVELDLFTVDQVDTMTEQERAIRGILEFNRDITSQIQLAFELQPPQSIERLAAIETQLAAWGTKNDTTARIVFYKPLEVYVRVNHFHRSTNILRVIEAIRDYVATHDGKLPASLSEITAVPVPNDPLTGTSFGYRKEGETAYLSAATIDHLDAEFAKQYSFDYKLVVMVTK